MRRTRFEWLTKMFRAEPTRDRTRRARAGNERHKWHWSCADGLGRIQHGKLLAYTRSEAKAAIKRLLGVKKLPADLLLSDLSKGTGRERAA